MYIILALLSGCLVVLSMVINSQLAKRIGVFRGTLTNYTVGFLCTLLIFGILKVPVLPYIRNLGIVPFWAFFGGVVGVAVVAASNVLVSKIPTVYMTLLTFTGQLLAGIVIDFAATGTVSFGKTAGVILIIMGLAYNSWVDKTYTAKSE